MLLDSRQGSHLVRIAARHADIDSAIRYTSPSSQPSEVLISLLGSQPLDVTPTFVEENFSLRCFCLIHLPDARRSSMGEPAEGICLFLYQVSGSRPFSFLRLLIKFRSKIHRQCTITSLPGTTCRAHRMLYASRVPQLTKPFRLIISLPGSIGPVP